MGGHGGLNILPQKRWNVYNFENREKVKKDEETAAREEQLKREQARKRDSEFRLEQLRRARGLDPVSVPPAASVAGAPASPVESKSEPKSDSKHINLFDGIKIFDPVVVAVPEERERKKMKKEEAPRVIGPEDEKYRLGYGLAGKGVKAPWYMMRPPSVEEEEEEREVGEKRDVKEKKKKKTVEEMREERLKREKAEKERERALFMPKGRSDGAGSSDRGYYWRSR